MRNLTLASASLLPLLLACDVPPADSVVEPGADAIQLSPDPAPLAAPPDATAQQRLARASNAFGLDLFHDLGRTPGNVAISPLSLESALALTWAGAKGDTEKELRTVLHLEGEPAEVGAQLAALSASLRAGDRGVRVDIANRLFGERTYAFQEPYLALARDRFAAPLDGLDFKRHPEAARRAINGWVLGKTEGRIKDLVPEGGVTDQTRLALVNAIYFLGDWQHPFAKEATGPRAFRLADGATKDVPTMFQLGSLPYAAVDGAQVVSLPYAGGSTSMLLVLPPEGAEGTFEAGLDAARVDALAAAARPTRIQLALPKFTIDPAASLELTPALRRLGLSSLFDAGRADLTAIADPPSAVDRLSVSAVFHKAFVKVDEKGTEAAAATAVVSRTGAAAPEPGLAVSFDRPFVFVIRDDESGAVLFIGRVADPV